LAVPFNLARDTARQIIGTGHATDTLRAALGAQLATATDGRAVGDAPNCASAR
jgi:hypothetical protein